MRAITLLSALLLGCDPAGAADAGHDAFALDVSDVASLDAPSSDDVTLDARLDSGEPDAPDRDVPPDAPDRDVPPDAPDRDVPPDARATCADAGGGDVVAACEAAALDMSTRCGSDRECEWLAIRDRCATERPDVLVAGMACTRMFSSDPGGIDCRSFSDPSGARDCIIAAHGCFDTTRAAAVATSVHEASVSLCGSVGADSPLHQAFIPFAALSGTTLDALEACATAIDCDGLRACVRAPFADLVACF